MRSHISLRGCVRPSVCPSVRQAWVDFWKMRHKGWNSTKEHQWHETIPSYVYTSLDFLWFERLTLNDNNNNGTRFFQFSTMGVNQIWLYRHHSLLLLQRTFAWTGVSSAYQHLTSADSAKKTFCREPAMKFMKRSDIKMEDVPVFG